MALAADSCPRESRARTRTSRRRDRRRRLRPTCKPVLCLADLLRTTDSALEARVAALEGAVRKLVEVPKPVDDPAGQQLRGQQLRADAPAYQPIEVPNKDTEETKQTKFMQKHGEELIFPTPKEAHQAVQKRVLTAQTFAAARGLRATYLVHTVLKAWIQTVKEANHAAEIVDVPPVEYVDKMAHPPMNAKQHEVVCVPRVESADSAALSFASSGANGGLGGNCNLFAGASLFGTSPANTAGQGSKPSINPFAGVPPGQLFAGASLFGSAASTAGTAEVAEVVHASLPLWMRKSEDVTIAEYASFYKLTWNELEDHRSVQHFSIAGHFEIRALLFNPWRISLDLFRPIHGKRNNIKLYIRRTLDMDEDEALPEWLNCVKGIVDSEALPQNFPRATLHQKKLWRAIKQNLVCKGLEMFAATAEQNDVHQTLYEQLGKYLKPDVQVDCKPPRGQPGIVCEPMAKFTWRLKYEKLHEQFGKFLEPDMQEKSSSLLS